MSKPNTKQRVMLVEQERDRSAAVKLVESMPAPFMLSCKPGKPRSYLQNRLMRLWCNELQEQGDQTAEEYRGYIKAWFGLPILIRDDENFAAQYERIIKPLAYEDKILLMQVPLDFPVTRLMTTKQEAEMLDTVYEHFTSQGFVLTDPEWQGL